MRLEGRRIAYFIEQEFEDLEYWVPVMRLREEGAEVITLGTGSKDEYTGKHGLTARPDKRVEDAAPADFHGVVVPGGWCPDKLRRYATVLNFVREMHGSGKIVAAICHGGWVLASAGIIQGCKATGSVGIKDDLVNAGAEWVDVSAFREGNLVWGRVVEDIPDFCRELVAALEAAG
jgi:protease I